MFEIKTLKVLCFSACCAPLVWLGFSAYQHGLGANPIEYLIHFSGLWALRLLLLTLCATPMLRFLAWTWPLQLRRMLGLFAFFYACLHVLAYVALDKYFAWAEMLEDILKRPYITIGLSAWLMLWPLALTSSQRMIARLGWSRWQRLHRLIYLLTLAVLLHYALLIKAGWTLAAPYIVIFVLLMALRLNKSARF